MRNIMSVCDCVSNMGWIPQCASHTLQAELDHKATHHNQVCLESELLIITARAA